LLIATQNDDVVPVVFGSEVLGLVLPNVVRAAPGG
jgi:hypothetical protein